MSHNCINLKQNCLTKKTLFILPYILFHPTQWHNITHNSIIILLCSTNNASYLSILLNQLQLEQSSDKDNSLRKLGTRVF